MANKVINNYVIGLNKEGYVNAFYTVLEGRYDYRGQMSDYPDACRGWYKFNNGLFVVDEARKAEILAEEEAEREAEKKKEEHEKKTDEQTLRLAEMFVQMGVNVDDFIDRMDAQLLYTSLMTDTLLEEEVE